MAKSDALSLDMIKVYLQSIGMISEFDIELSEKIFSQGKVLCPEEFKTIFVSNYKEKDGKEQFKDLWLFSDNYLVEALNFNKNEPLELGVVIISNNIQSVSIETKNFDSFKQANDNSSLRIEFYTYSEFSCEQIAHGRNCDALMAIYNKYVKPNIVRGQSR